MKIKLNTKPELDNTKLFLPETLQTFRQSFLSGSSFLE